MKQEILDVIVIGAGQSGLCTSLFLKKYGLKHIVVERGKIGESWRSQRWDSFRLNTPNKLNLVAEDLPGTPNEFATAAEYVSALARFVKKHQLPVMENAKVLAIEKTDVFKITANDQTWFAKQVVVASGAQSEKKLPLFAKQLSESIQQLHTSEYRNAQQLNAGAVLVAGSGQSGVQIVDDLLDAGRKVYFSTSMVARVPRTYRGRDIMDWLMQINFFDARAQDITDPAMLNMKPPQLTGVGGNKTISLQMLAKKGAVILGKVENVHEKMISLKDNAAQHVQFADGFSKMIKSMIDEAIQKNNIDAPPASPDEADMPDTEATCVTHITSLNLEEQKINSIIWATGFACNFRYIKLPVLDEEGMPIHESGISNIEGLYFVGLPWMRSRKSSLIYGAKGDAEFIAGKVYEAGKSSRIAVPLPGAD